MNSLVFAIVGLVATMSLGFILQAYGQSQISGIYEDQFVLCSFEGECLTFNQDDYLSNSQIEEFQLFFDNDMDTYSLEDLID